MFPLQGLSTKISIMGPLQRSNNNFIWKTLCVKKSRAQIFLVQGRLGLVLLFWVGFPGPSDSSPSQLIPSYEQFSLAIVVFDFPHHHCPHVSGSLGSINDHLSTFLSSLYIHSNLYQNIHWASATLTLSSQEVCSKDILSHYPLPRLPTLPL